MKITFHHKRIALPLIVGMIVGALLSAGMRDSILTKKTVNLSWGYPKDSNAPAEYLVRCKEISRNGLDMSDFQEQAFLIKNNAIACTLELTRGKTYLIWIVSRAATGAESLPALMLLRVPSIWGSFKGGKEVWESYDLPKRPAEKDDSTEVLIDPFHIPERLEKIKMKAI
jgi:hypothetical protein